MGVIEGWKLDKVLPCSRKYSAPVRVGRRTLTDALGPADVHCGGPHGTQGTGSAVADALTVVGFAIVVCGFILVEREAIRRE